MVEGWNNTNWELVNSSTYHTRQMIQRGKLSRLCTNTLLILMKTFAVQTIRAITYCAQQMTQGKNFCDELKNDENCKSFPPSFPSRNICCVWHKYNHPQIISHKIVHIKCFTSKSAYVWMLRQHVKASAMWDNVLTILSMWWYSS